MDLKNINSSVNIGKIYGYLSVETTGTEKCGIKNVGTVSCGDNDNSFVRAESVHLNEKLVEGLLTLVVTAAETCASVTADCVDLVYEYDGSGGFSRRVKEVAYTGSAYTDVHFNEIRSRY